MLRQSKAVRASYVRNVVDAKGDPQLLTEIWMLLQPDEVRESYVREVLEPRLADGEQTGAVLPEPRGH